MEFLKLCAFILVVVHLPPQNKAQLSQAFSSALFVSMNGGKSSSNSDSLINPEVKLQPTTTTTPAMTMPTTTTPIPTVLTTTTTTTMAPTTTTPTTYIPRTTQTSEPLRHCPDYTPYFLTVAQADQLKATEYKTISVPFNEDYCLMASTLAYKSFSFSEKDGMLSAYVYTDKRNAYKRFPSGEYYIPVYMFSNTAGSCQMYDGSILHNNQMRIEKLSPTSISEVRCRQFSCEEGILNDPDNFWYWTQMGQHKCARFQKTTDPTLVAGGPRFKCGHEWGAELLTVESDEESDFLNNFVKGVAGYYNVDVLGPTSPGSDYYWAKSNRVPKITWNSNFIYPPDYEEFKNNLTALNVALTGQFNFQYVKPDMLIYAICTVNV